MKKTLRSKILKCVACLALLFTLHTVTPPSAQAQCPMCKMSAESNLNNGGSAGKGLNAGILFMLATPYILVGIVGLVWWRNKKREEEIEEA